MVGGGAGCAVAPQRAGDDAGVLLAAVAAFALAMGRGRARVRGKNGLVALLVGALLLGAATAQAFPILASPVAWTSHRRRPVRRATRFRRLHQRQRRTGLGHAVVIRGPNALDFQLLRSRRCRCSSARAWVLLRSAFRADDERLLTAVIQAEVAGDSGLPTLRCKAWGSVPR